MVFHRLRKVHLKFNPNKCCFGAHSDAPPNSFIKSNVNPKVQTMKEGVGACSFIHNILGVRRGMLNSGIGTRTNDEWINYSYLMHPQTF